MDVTAEVDQLERLDAVAVLAVCFGGVDSHWKDFRRESVRLEPRMAAALRRTFCKCQLAWAARELRLKRRAGRSHAAEGAAISTTWRCSPGRASASHAVGKPLPRPRPIRSSSSRLG